MFENGRFFFNKEVYPNSRGGRVGSHFGKNHSQCNRLDSNLDHPVIGSPVYCESSALDHVATEAGFGGGSNHSKPNENASNNSARDFLFV
ncbi:unnamed protein product [Timema podura]|uniref:Uncharacterized protein n=1 Tax=Timema podura TaxID=61482 RepID=A0ABN7PN20_TIMPD|nr:unnamed protein product [Timema podura]